MFLFQTIKRNLSQSNITRKIRSEFACTEERKKKRMRSFLFFSHVFSFFFFGFCCLPPDLPAFVSIFFSSSFLNIHARTNTYQQQRHYISDPDSKRETMIMKNLKEQTITRKRVDK